MASPVANQEVDNIPASVSTSSPALSSASIISGVSDFFLADSTPDSGGMDSHAVARRTDDATAPKHASTPFARHYMRNGMIEIEIEDALFRVPQFALSRDSAYFRDQFDAQRTEEISCMTIKEEDVTATDFARLLDVLYPAEFGTVSLTSSEEWISVLHLSYKWSFQKLRTLAIERLFNLTSPVDKVVLGRKYNVHEWLLDAYIALCKRPEPLTLDEGSRMIIEDIIKISEARHNARVYSGLAAPEEIRAMASRVFLISHDEPPKSGAAAPIPILPETCPTLNVVKNSVDINAGKPMGEPLEPIDIPWITRMVMKVSENKSDFIAPAIIALVKPYGHIPSAVEAVIEVVSQRASQKYYHGSDTDMKGLVDLVISISKIVDIPNESNSDDQIPDGCTSTSPWYTCQLVKACHKAVNNWKCFNDPAARMAAFFEGLIRSKFITDGVFIPCWRALIRAAKKPNERWCAMVDCWLSKFGRLIKTESCGLLIDDFSVRVQERIDKLDALGHRRSYSDNPLLQNLQNVAAHCT